MPKAVDAGHSRYAASSLLGDFVIVVSGVTYILATSQALKIHTITCLCRIRMTLVALLVSAPAICVLMGERLESVVMNLYLLVEIPVVAILQ